MATGPRYSVKFRRRREGRTDYAKRAKMLASNLPRLVVRKSIKYITAQLISYSPEGDRTIATANSIELKKLDWKYNCKNISAAYLTGLLLGKRAVAAGVEKAILDIGLYTTTKGSRLFAALKGAVDAGLKIPHNPKVLPDSKRIAGQHIAEWLKKPAIQADFEKVKNKILEKKHGKTEKTV